MPVVHRADALEAEQTVGQHDGIARAGVVGRSVHGKAGGQRYQRRREERLVLVHRRDSVRIGQAVGKARAERAGTPA